MVFSITAQVIIFVVLLSCAGIIVLLVGECQLNNTKCPKIATNFNTQCFIYNKNAAPILLRGRGTNYFLHNTRNATAEQTNTIIDYSKNCIVTYWGLSHFTLYFLLGLLAPNLFWISFTVNILFEYLEYRLANCHDFFDIVLNTAGLITGYYLSSCI